MRTDRRFEDYDDAFENGILKDGARVRVPLQMRDSARPTERPLTPTEMHDAMVCHHQNALVTDGTGNPWGLSRPGWRIPVDRSVRDHQRQVLQDAYEEYERGLREAYKTPGTSPASNTGSHEFSSAPQEDDPCSKDGYSGNWETDEQTGELCCRIDRRATGSSDGRSLAQLIRDRAAVMEPIYEQVARELSEAWKSK
jgi:hypothetical protein